MDNKYSQAPEKIIQADSSEPEEVKSPNRYAVKSIEAALQSGDLETAILEANQFNVPVSNFATAVISAVTGSLKNKDYQSAVTLFQTFSNPKDENDPIRPTRYATAIRDAIAVALIDGDYQSARSMQETFNVRKETIATTLRNTFTSAKTEESKESFRRAFPDFKF